MNFLVQQSTAVLGTMLRHYWHDSPGLYVFDSGTMRSRVPLLAFCQTVPSLSFVQPSIRCFQSPTPRAPSHVHLPSMVAAAPSSFAKPCVDDGTGHTGQPYSELMGTEQSTRLRVVEIYDTTLRDGTQMEGISASVNDKLKIAKELHNFGTVLSVTFRERYKPYDL